MSFEAIFMIVLPREDLRHSKLELVRSTALKSLRAVHWCTTHTALTSVCNFKPLLYAHSLEWLWAVAC